MASFRFPPSPLSQEGLHLSLYSLSSGEGKIENFENPSFSKFWYRSRSLCPKGRAMRYFMRWISTWKCSTSKPISSVTCTAAPVSQTCSVMPKPNTRTIQSWRSAPCGGCGGKKGENEIKALRKIVGDREKGDALRRCAGSGGKRKILLKI